MDDNLKQYIDDIISSFTQLPYLFIGTGFAMRYSSAPSWDKLLFDMWKLMNDGDELKYKKLKQGIEFDLKNKLINIGEEQRKYYINPQLASSLQEQFNTKYFKDEKFYEDVFSIDEINEITEYNYDPFKYYTTKKLENMSLVENNSEYHEIEMLSKNKNKIAGVITTNYDTVVEQIFSDFEVMVGQDNMLLSNMSSIFEIFKIHGSIKSPNSIIITQEDYARFEDKLKYLSAKLLTIFVEHPIIFIGYGMGDLNILKILGEISQCLDIQQIQKIKNKFIFITRSKDKREYAITKEIKGLQMVELVLEDYSSIYNALGIIKSSMPVKLMRKLQDMVCKYVYSVEATNNIIFGNINSPDIEENKAAIYVGTKDAISQIGFDYFTIDDILEDILLDNKPFIINEKLITKTFKNIRSIAGTTYLPIYKYVNKLGMEMSDVPSNYNIIRTYNDMNPNQSEEKYINKEIHFDSIEKIELAYPNHLVKQIANIKKYASNIEADELHSYIIKHYCKETYKEQYPSFKKLIALYDFKKYS